MSLGIWQILLIVVLIVLLFGRGKISGLMGDLAQGIKSFRKGMKDDGDDNTADKPSDSKILELEAGKSAEAKTRQSDKERIG